MEIYIKDMEMPKNCAECGISQKTKSGVRCPIASKRNHFSCTTAVGSIFLPFYCPLVEVPPHGRLGDLDKLEQMFVDIDNAPYSGFDGSEPFYSAEDAAKIIRLSPTIIPADKDGE